ncbi:acetylajmalan esterase-like [Lycium barbarum]|uniref:acetylajmalan esterase-like n=1 Tax=Lycium barbarum TaxID=112863 RepID=UPI00293F2A53|nr:acetylajmalan esterase-like [Lycium barbarum]
MALTIQVLLLQVLTIVFFLVLLKSDAQLMVEVPPLMKCKFDKIYQLGDSLSDTGNFIRESFLGAFSPFAKLPYGQNFPQNKSTGRCSDGLLMIDFIAQGCGLPLLNPYKDQNANFTHGANFAVAGATALPTEIMVEKKISSNSLITNSSLSVQLDWMFSHFKSTCSSADCSEDLKRALFLVGEIGGNEINYGLLQGKPIEELRAMVPEIVQIIINAVKAVIGFGAVRIVIPGNFPIGCIPNLLTTFSTTNSTAYNEYHCLKDLNNLAIFYNDHLQKAIQDLKKDSPKIILIYGDYYNAYQWLLKDATNLGFGKNSLQKACCGIGGDYNYDKSRICGAPGVPICGKPGTFISWDGVHLTQAAYKWLTKWLIDDTLPKLNCQV